MDEKTVKIEAKNLAMLLEGINIWSRFSDVHFEHVI
jgi:hypothetical protein